MKIFNKGSSRSKPACSYCRETSHRISDCPYAETDWESLRQGIIPLTTLTPVTWYKAPRYWGDWYMRAQNAVEKIEAARNRASRRTTATQPRSCGFCGDTGHTRRTCGHMNSFITKCQKANANWKRAAYDYLVGTLGIYVGSAIKAFNRHPKTDSLVGLITSVNYDKLNVMTAFEGRYGHHDFVQPIEIYAIFNGASKTIRFNRDLLRNTSILSTHCVPYHFGGYSYSAKMTSTATPLDESWATDNNGEWEWLVRRKSYAFLKESGIASHIESWASRSQ